MARGQDPEVVRSALEWIKFRDKGRPSKDKSANKKKDKVATETEDIVAQLTERLGKS